MSTSPANWNPIANRATSAGAPGAKRKRRRLDSQEVRRRVWHMAPGLLPFLLWVIPHADPLTPLISWIFVGIFLALTGALFWNWKRVARKGVGNGDRAAAIFGYAGTVLLTLFLFPDHAEIGLTLFGVLAFGDGSATLFGKLIGGPRLPWNAEKSVGGLVGFVLVGLPMAALIYWGESNSVEGVGTPATVLQSLLIAAAGVTAGAIAESLRSPINDNIRVGVAAAAALVLAHAAIIGL